MATITIPDGSTFAPSSTSMRRSQGIHVCPYSLKQTVQNWGGKKRVMDVTIPIIQDSTEMASWAQFFEDLNGMVNTFILDISTFWPNDAGASSVAFRLTKPDVGWSMDIAQRTQFSFQAIEV